MSHVIASSGALSDDNLFFSFRNLLQTLQCRVVQPKVMIMPGMPDRLSLSILVWYLGHPSCLESIYEILTAPLS